MSRISLYISAYFNVLGAINKQSENVYCSELNILCLREGIRIVLISIWLFLKFICSVNIIDIRGLQRPPGVFSGSFLSRFQKWLVFATTVPVTDPCR